MKTLIIGTLDFLGHIYAAAMIIGGAFYGFTAYGVVGLFGGLLGGVFLASITVGLIFLLLDIRDTLRRLVELMEADRAGGGTRPRQGSGVGSPPSVD